tara:strand:+ start:151 stop:1602 length:1452 start_codon:yes stop_codon:yes gene_type:complete
LKENKLYIGGDFLDSQLLWIIPIANQFCEQKKINSICFQKKLSKKIINNKIISLILKKYKINYLTHNSYGNTFKRITLLRFVPKALVDAITFNKKDLLNKDISWKKIQKLHAIWDQARRMSKDKQLTPSFTSIFLSCIIQCKFENLANKAIKNGINFFFLGHAVYGHRSFLAQVNKKGSNIFIHKNTSFYKQYFNLDNAWNFISKKNFNFMLRNISKDKINRYFLNRSKGKGRYLDSRIAANIKNNQNAIYENVIFLHIFRDSPYTYIDRKRIFIDYYDWVFFTLNTIKNTNNKWLIKFHPSYSRWGEKQDLIVKEILKKLDLSNAKNLFFDNKKISNNQIYDSAKKIVTFSGTSHIEAVANKIKPITISETMLSNFKSSLVLKPKSINEYKKLLLKNNDSDIFKATFNEVNLAKSLIYLRENALKIDKDIGGFHVFSKDKSNIINKDFDLVLKKLHSNKDYLSKLGNFLAKNNYLVSYPFLK